MGIRDNHFNPLVTALFGEAFVDPAGSTNVYSETEVLVIDGSLFYRAGGDWSRTGTTWGDWLRSVFDRLDRLLDRFFRVPASRLRVVVFRVDMYGGEHIVEPLQKQACQAHRYIDPRAIDNPLHAFRADQPIGGITANDTFGVMSNRLAFNAMFTEALAGASAELVHDCYFGRTALAHRARGLTMIVEGGVGCVDGSPEALREPLQV